MGNKNVPDYSFAIVKFEKIVNYITSFEESNTQNTDSLQLYGEGKVIGFFEIDKKPIIIVEIFDGEFNVDDSILVMSGNKKMKSRITVIEKNRKLVENAALGESVGLMIEGNYTDFLFMENGGIVAKII
jgi:translation initiation factor IF-2